MPQKLACSDFQPRAWSVRGLTLPGYNTHENGDLLTCGFVVVRDGVEPPTSRFQSRPPLVADDEASAFVLVTAPLTTPQCRYVARRDAAFVAVR